MTRWSIAQNDYYFTSFIVLENAPWYIFLLQTCIQHICSWFPRIPLPPKKIIRDGHEYTARDYYGTTQDLFHVYVCAPIFCWCDDRIKTEFIDFPYQLLEDKFPEYFKSDDLFTEEEVKENREYSERIGKLFNITYEKLKNITSDRRKV